MTALRPLAAVEALQKRVLLLLSRRGFQYPVVAAQGLAIQFGALRAFLGAATVGAAAASTSARTAARTAAVRTSPLAFPSVGGRHAGSATIKTLTTRTTTARR
jgi:hypothetical protein